MCVGVEVGARLLLDCSQSVPNMPVDVQSLGADWIVATGHKMCGPTGIGFLWGRYGHTVRSALTGLAAKHPFQHAPSPAAACIECHF